MGIALYVITSRVTLCESPATNHSRLFSSFSIMHYLVPGNSFLHTTLRKPASVLIELVLFPHSTENGININNPLHSIFARHLPRRPLSFNSNTS